MQEIFYYNKEVCLSRRHRVG